MVKVLDCGLEISKFGKEKLICPIFYKDQKTNTIWCSVCNIIVRGFELCSHNYIHSQTNNLWERYEPSYSPDIS